MAYRTPVLYADFTGSLLDQTVAPVWQYDTGLRLNITGLSGRVIEVQYGFEGGRETVNDVPVETNGVLVSSVPDVVLMQDQPVTAYIYLDENDAEYTIRAVHIPLIPRPMPPDVVYTPEQMSQYDRLVARLDDMIDSVEAVADKTDAIDAAYAKSQAILEGTYVSSVNGEDGDVTLDIPTKTSDLTNDSGFITASSVPTRVSDLTNDSGYITSAPVSSVNTKTGAVVLTGADMVVSSTDNRTLDVAIAAAAASGGGSGSGESSGGAVQSVNGETGVVVLDASDVGALPSNTTYVSGVNGSSGSVTLRGTDIQVSTTDLRTVAAAIADAAQTGGASSGVTSVNNKTGDVTITAADLGALTTAPVSSVNGKTGTVVLTASDVGAMASNAQVVKSVNGSTGAVRISLPTKVSDLPNDAAYITAADLPENVSDLENDAGYLTSTTGVSSFNGQHGAVTATIVSSVNGQSPTNGAVTVNATQIKAGATGDTTVAQAIAAVAATAGVTSVNNYTGDVMIDIPQTTSELENNSGFITNTDVMTTLNNLGYVTASNVVTSLNNQTGAQHIAFLNRVTTGGTTLTEAQQDGGTAVELNGANLNLEATGTTKIKDAINTAQQAAASAAMTDITTTIPATWTQRDGYADIHVNVANMTATTKFFVDVNISQLLSADDIVAALDGWGMVDRANGVTGEVIFYAYHSVPEVSIPVTIRMVGV